MLCGFDLASLTFSPPPAAHVRRVRTGSHVAVGGTAAGDNGGAGAATDVVDDRKIVVVVFVITTTTIMTFTAIISSSTVTMPQDSLTRAQRVSYRQFFNLNKLGARYLTSGS